MAAPIIREAALFLNDWLVEYQGEYVTCPSTSPENQFRLPDGQTTSVTYASSMDMAIVREVFGNYMKICEILGTQDSLLDEIREKPVSYTHLDVYKRQLPRSMQIRKPAWRQG